ncbi:MAG: acyl-ACP--UDP-N-acetylglucosamine O-acyltransferase [Bacteroides sp.]|nr:acyl-ACP--UDP-N-acetylglucosamine O-acyltransferase [Bacteroides sp.]MDE7462772.1 acyl-ACP--UDP-N-acetylglucosamine O-acyltransferase [Muribaculaceae bacterium]
MNKISNLAYVDPNAKLGDNIIIEPFAYVEGNVEIGDGCHIRPNAVLRSGARIGRNCHIYEGSVISATPQDFRWKGESSFVTIGDNTVIREHVIINRSIHEGHSTKVGSNSFILAQTHIGHDSKIGDYCVLGNAVKIAGDVKIGDYSILSSNSLVHEKCDVGEWCLIKGGCRVNSHVPPYVIMGHNPIEYKGVNSFILRKGNFAEDVIDAIASAYRHIYHSNTSAYNARRRVKADITDCEPKDKILAFMDEHNLKLAALPKDLNQD